MHELPYHVVLDPIQQACEMWLPVVPVSFGDVPEMYQPNREGRKAAEVEAGCWKPRKAEGVWWRENREQRGKIGDWRLLQGGIRRELGARKAEGM